MAVSWPIFVSGCKSRFSALARSCYLRRRHWQQKYLQAKQAQKELQRSLADCEAQCRELQRQNHELREQVGELQAQQAEPRPLELPLGEAPPGQQYGANLMALAVNLGRQLGIRPAHHALKIFCLAEDGHAGADA